jgi:PAS domain S-box-containing protein
LRAGLAAGRYPEASGREQQWLAERLALHVQANSVHEQQLPDNRWLRICERRTADGGSIGIRIDISEIKQREESVRTLFKSNPVPMLVIDCADLKFLAVNDAAVRHYGYTREQFLTMTMLDILPPEDRQHYAELFRAYRESERLEFDSATVRRHRRADGSDVLVNVYVTSWTIRAERPCCARSSMLPNGSGGGGARSQPRVSGPGDRQCVDDHPGEGCAHAAVCAGQPGGRAIVGLFPQRDDRKDPARGF